MPALIQRPAPVFKASAVVEGLFQEISLSDYLGKWFVLWHSLCLVASRRLETHCVLFCRVVLFFYPMDFTFVCPTEILAFNDALPQFKALNTQVIGTPTSFFFGRLSYTT